jgi:hypothetical protein
VLVIVAFIVSGETPDVGDSKREIVDFYLDNDSSQQFAIAEGGSSSAASPSVNPIPAKIDAPTAITSPPRSATVESPPSSPATARRVRRRLPRKKTSATHPRARRALALNALNSDMFFTVAVGTAVLNLALGLAVLRHGGLPRPLGWVALVIGIASLTPAGFFAFLATGIVIVWASIALAMEADAPAESPSVANP